jgi:DNA-binding transcriptional LysR family regulator
MKIRNAWHRHAAEMTARIRKSGAVSQRLGKSVTGGLSATASVAGEAYSAALNWKNNSEFSNWLTDHFSNQVASIGSKAMDAEYLRTHIGRSWHRLYDGGHSLIGSWKAVSESLPDLSALDQLGIWANEYWKDLIITRGMPILILDHADKVSEYFKHLDCANVAQVLGGEVCGVSIYCNWNDPAKLVASATATECSGIVYANVVSPLVSLIGLGRAFYLLQQSEQGDLQDLVAPALNGLARGGASVLLITVIPGGFLLHLSCLPAVLARLKKSRPQLQVSVTDGMGSSLFQQLRQGDFDFVFGRIDQDIDPHEFSADVLFNDSLVVVARRDHPLARTRPGQKMKWEETEWILPSGDNPARTAFEKTFYARSGKAPRSTIDSNSFVTMLTIISLTDLLGIAPHQIFSVAWLQQAFMVLDLGLKFPVQPTGVIRRARSAPSAVAQYAINELRHAARQVAKPKPANAAPAA